MNLLQIQSIYFNVCQVNAMNILPANLRRSCSKMSMRCTRTSRRSGRIQNRDLILREFKQLKTVQRELYGAKPKHQEPCIAQNYTPQLLDTSKSSDSHHPRINLFYRKPLCCHDLWQIRTVLCGVAICSTM